MVTFSGAVAAIYVASAGGAPMEPVSETTAVAGAGLHGDRYAAGNGTFSKPDRPHQQVTLIESEALTAASADAGYPIDAEVTRRNVVTAGVPLNHLLGRRFRIGEATFEGVKLCEPCSYIERLAGKDVRRFLIHRGGLNAIIVESGRIAPGDAVTVQGDAVTLQGDAVTPTA